MHFRGSQRRTDGVFAIEKLPIHNKQNKLSVENHFRSYIDSKFTRVEVFIAIHLMTRPVCWNATLRRCTCASRRFEENPFPSSSWVKILLGPLDPVDEGTTFLRNIGEYFMQ